MAEKTVTPAEEPDVDPIDAAADSPQEGHLPAQNTGFVPGKLDMEEDLVLTPKEFPILKITSDQGGMSKHFEPGVVGFETPDPMKLVDGGGDTFDILIVGLASFIKERRAFKRNDPIPYKIYKTRQEALAAGEILEWVQNKNGPDTPPTAQYAANMVLLVPLPEGEMTTAPVVRLFDKTWIPARFYAEKSHYDGAARNVIRATKMQLDGDFTKALWSFYSTPSKSTEYDNYLANIKLNRLLTEDEHKEFVEALGQFGDVQAG